MKNVKYWKYFEINSMNIGITNLFLECPDDDYSDTVWIALQNIKQKLSQEIPRFIYYKAPDVRNVCFTLFFLLVLLPLIT